MGLLSDCLIHTIIGRYLDLFKQHTCSDMYDTFDSKLRAMDVILIKSPELQKKLLSAEEFGETSSKD